MKQRETHQVASVCVLWHEGETGRSYDDVAIAYFLYSEHRVPKREECDKVAR